MMIFWRSSGILKIVTRVFTGTSAAGGYDPVQRKSKAANGAGALAAAVTSLRTRPRDGLHHGIRARREDQRGFAFGGRGLILLRTGFLTGGTRSTVPPAA